MTAAYAIGALLGAELANLLLPARREAEREREEDENEADDVYGGVFAALRNKAGG